MTSMSLAQQWSFPTRSKAVADPRSLAVSPHHQLAFWEPFATMLAAGVPVDSAVEGLAKGSHQPEMRAVLDGIVRRLQNGQTFDEALHDFPRTFSSELCAIIDSGFSAGEFPAAAADVCIMLNDTVRMKRLLFKPAIMPLVTFVAALAAVMINLYYVMPGMGSMYDKVPPEKLLFITRWMLSASHVYVKHPHLIHLSLLSIVASLWLWSRSYDGRVALTRAFNALPVVGAYMTKVRRVRVLRQFVRLIASGLPESTALRKASAGIVDPVVRTRYYTVATMLEEGTDLVVAFQESGLFTNDMLTYVDAGIRAGDLKGLLGAAVRAEAQRLEYQLSTLAESLTPILVVVIGSVIGILQAGMYGGLFGVQEYMASQAGKGIY